MKFLIIKHWIKGTYYTDTITREDLVEAKRDSSMTIIDLENSKYYDQENNVWVVIETKSNT